MLFITGPEAVGNYGIATSDLLKNDICLNSLAAESQYFPNVPKQVFDSRSMHDTHTLREKIQNFVESFAHSPYYIDLFLMRNYDTFGEIGKLILAGQILKYEKIVKDCFAFYLRNKSDDWLTWLYKKCIPYDTTFGELQRVIARLPKFLSFQYDRTIEYFFQTFIRNDFSNHSDLQMDTMLETFLFIDHAFGSLGSLFVKSNVQFADTVSLEKLKNASGFIKVMYHERNKLASRFDYIKKEDTLVFAGFNFEQFNLKAMDFQNLQAKKVYAHVHGKTAFEKKLIDKKICIAAPEAQIELFDCSIVQMLRELPELHRVAAQ